MISSALVPKAGEAVSRIRTADRIGVIFIFLECEGLRAIALVVSGDRLSVTGGVEGWGTRKQVNRGKFAGVLILEWPGKTEKYR